MDIFLKNNINMLKELLIVILSIWIVLHVELCAVLQTTVFILYQAREHIGSISNQVCHNLGLYGVT